MLTEVTTRTYAGADVLIVGWTGNSRGTATHSGIVPAEAPRAGGRGGVRLAAVAALAELDGAPERVVGIDEGQFFPDLAEACRRWAAGGKLVVVAALDADFLARPFAQVSLLVPQCDWIRKCRGVCMACQARRSLFSQRLGGGLELVEIGAADRYRAVCRECFEAKLKGPGAGD